MEDFILPPLFISSMGQTGAKYARDMKDLALCLPAPRIQAHCRDILYRKQKCRSYQGASWWLASYLLSTPHLNKLLSILLTLANLYGAVYAFNTVVI
jgi:hypothetical protein